MISKYKTKPSALKSCIRNLQIMQQDSAVAAKKHWYVWTDESLSEFFSIHPPLLSMGYDQKKKINQRLKSCSSCPPFPAFRPSVCALQNFILPPKWCCSGRAKARPAWGRFLSGHVLPGRGLYLEMGYQNSIVISSRSVGLKVLYLANLVLKPMFVQPMLPTM